MKKIFSLLFLLFSLSLSAEESIRFGVFAYKGVEQTRKQYAPLAEALTEKLGVPVVLELLTQEEMNAKMARGELDIITTNPTHFLHIRQSYHLDGAVATLEVYNKGVATDALAGVIVVKNKSTITKLQDLKGKKISKNYDKVDVNFNQYFDSILDCFKVKIGDKYTLVSNTFEEKLPLIYDKINFFYYKNLPDRLLLERNEKQVIFDIAKWEETNLIFDKIHYLLN